MMPLLKLLLLLPPTPKQIKFAALSLIDPVCLGIPGNPQAKEK